jgi:hypothetical protein
MWVDMIGIIDTIGRLSTYQHVDFRGRNAAAIDPADTQFSSDVERSYGSVQELFTDAGVKKCANRHVSTYP